MKQAFHLVQQIIFSVLVSFSAFFSAGVFGQDVAGNPPSGGNSPPEVRLVLPENGAKFNAPATVQLAAQGSDPDGWISTVEFFANERSLGTTTNNPLSASAVNPFQLSWPNVPAGEYSLRAKATDDKGASAISAVVKITVVPAPVQAEVSVATIKDEATEQGDSKSRTLIFRFVRTGSLEFDIPVFYSIKGTATMGQDFPNLPGRITIPKGAEFAELSFEVLDDNLPEPEETVILRVEPPVCIAIYPPPPECYRVGARAEAHGVIAASDQLPSDRPIVSIVATVAETAEPSPEVRVQPGRFLVKRSGDANAPLLVWLEIGGSAEAGRDYEQIPRSLVFETGILSKEILVAPLDDQIVEGDETVSAEIVPVPPELDTPFPTNYSIDPEHRAAKLVIHDNDRVVTGSTLEMTAPKDGAEFRAPALVRIEATAIDPLGDIRLVEFYANGQLIGKSEQLTRDAVIPGRPRYHVLEWNDVPAGRYELIAKAKDTAGKEVISKPVRIAVIGGPDVPVVSIEATIGETAESSLDALVRPGRFTISRRGGGDGALPVFFELGGTARNGEDYKKITKWVIIPGNTNQVNVDIAALDDALVEGDETVEIKLTTQQSDDFPFLMPIREYAIDPDHSAARVVIHDNDKPTGPAMLAITSPKDGQRFLAPEVVGISATAIDPNGYISRVEFYAGDQKIGVSELVFVRAPDPGTPIYHTFEWKQPPVGSHALTARAVDAAGGKVVSKAVGIIVERAGERMTVSVEATDPIASESAGPDGVVDTATFTVRRVAGPRDVAVTVFYKLDGTARNGIDYQELNGRVTLPSGESSAKIIVVPIADKALEGEETVLLKIQEPACPEIFLPPPECYQIAPPGSAIAVIRDGPASQLPKVAIVRPVSGAEYSSEADIEIVAEVRDSDGYVSKVEFLADGRTIGAQNMAFFRPPSPGETQTFRFVWRDPMPGSHTLTARATDNDGGSGLSQPVEIKVREADSRPIVSVIATDAFAVEPASNAEANMATFLIRRAGSTNGALTVSYSMHGTAENGIDYEKLSGVAIIPAGLSATTVIVRPLPDNLTERNETVILQLETPMSLGTQDTPYRVKGPPRAVALIRDASLAKAMAAEAKGEAKCSALADGMMHICLPGQAGLKFRIEASNDFLNWETVSDATESDGSVHFVDDTASSPQKFYRVVQEPSPAP